MLPEGSPQFRASYVAAEKSYAASLTRDKEKTINWAVQGYLSSADFKQTAPATQRVYRYYLKHALDHYAEILVDEVNATWVDWLRDTWPLSPVYWNGFRHTMNAVFKRVMKLHPGVVTINPWADVRRLQVDQSDQNRHWPDEVLVRIVREATPEFRALLITLLLTGQRIGDVSAFQLEQYNAEHRTIRFQQGKTGKWVVLHVPRLLADTFERMSGRLEHRLLVTPRGKPWTVSNAEEHLLVLRTNLGIDRYTLHGLRATGPTALKMLGFENRQIRELTGHDSDATLEVYLRGAGGYEMAREAQEALEGRFSDSLSQALMGANERKFAGKTGRASAKTGRVGSARSLRQRQRAESRTVKPVSNCQTVSEDVS